MIGSLWSGISGLQSHQTQMNVIGNDVANVNTVGYKQSNITFQDAFYQSLGSNQVGLGSSVGNIAIDFNSGMLKETGVVSNMAISGDGFFVVKDTEGFNTGYTRAGDFQLEYDSTSGMKNLVSPSGKLLYGSSGAAQGSASELIELPSDIQAMTISGEGIISYIDGNGATVSDAFRVDVATFPGMAGLKQDGNNQYSETSESGPPLFTSTDYQVVQGYLENSNVDLADEFTEMIVAERGFQANSKTITTSDSMLQELLNLKR